MNTRLKNAALVSITPYPKKFRFEGVDYRQGSKDLIIYGIPSYVLLLTAISYAPVIADKARELTTKFKNRHKK